MTLIRSADMADFGTMNGHQKYPAALIRTIPTRCPRVSAEGAVDGGDLRRPMPPISDGFLTNERISVRIPATPTKTTAAQMAMNEHIDAQITVPPPDGGQLGGPD
jgi:hypothetical protein